MVLIIYRVVVVIFYWEMGVLNGLDKFLWDLKIQRLADEGIECVYILASHSISVRFAEWESVKSIVIIF